MKFLLFVSCKDIKKKICGNWASVRPKCKRCVYHASAPHPKTRHQQRYHYQSITSLLCIIPGFIRYKYLRKQDSNCERTNIPSPLLLVSSLCKWISVCFCSLYVSVPIFLCLLVLCVYYISRAGVHDPIRVLGCSGCGARPDVIQKNFSLTEWVRRQRAFGQNSVHHISCTRPIVADQQNKNTRTMNASSFTCHADLKFHWKRKCWKSLRHGRSKRVIWVTPTKFLGCHP